MKNFLRLLFTFAALSVPSYAQEKQVGIPFICVPASGSGTAYTCTTAPSFTPATKDQVLFKADVANTGSATLNVNSSSAATIKKQGGGTNLAANDLIIGQWVTLVYDGTNWQMQGQLGNAVVTTTGSPAANQVATFSNGSVIQGIDFPDVKFIPAANCNNATAGNGWSIGSGGTVTCRAGTNNLGGYVSITDTSSTFATFQIPIPEDWDSSSRPYIRFQLASTDATNAHTVIPEVNIACYKGDGSTTDDVAANGFHSLSTVTLNGNANRFWSTSNVQMNSTDMTGCVAGALMQVTVGRATDTATNAEFYGATITFPRLLTVQAN